MIYYTRPQCEDRNSNTPHGSTLIKCPKHQRCPRPWRGTRSAAPPDQNPGPSKGPKATRTRSTHGTGCSNTQGGGRRPGGDTTCAHTRARPSTPFNDDPTSPPPHPTLPPTTHPSHSAPPPTNQPIQYQPYRFTPSKPYWHTRRGTLLRHRGGRQARAPLHLSTQRLQ